MDDLPTNRGPQVIALRWGLLAFVLLTLTLRLACRKISTQSFWWDDYLAIIGMVRFGRAVDGSSVVLTKISLGLLPCRCY